MTMATIVSNPQVFAQEPPQNDGPNQCKEDCKTLYDIAKQLCNERVPPGLGRALCHITAAAAYASCLLGCRVSE